MTDEAAPETRDDQPARGTEVARRTQTDDWLSRQTGVDVIDTDDGRMIKLSAELAQRVNLLVPISQVVQLDRNWTPVPRIVTLEKGTDTYERARKKNDATGRWEAVHDLTAKGLQKIADLMGIHEVSKPLWGQPPDGARGIKCTVTAVMRGPDGLLVPSVKSKTIRFDEHLEKLRIDAVEKWERFEKANWESAERKRAAGEPLNEKEQKARPPHTERSLRKLEIEEMEHIDSKCETKALNRCVRELAKIRPLFESELAKPFLTIGYFLTPDQSDPRAMELVRMQYEQSANALYGSGAEAGAAVAELGPADDEPENEPTPPLLDHTKPLPHESAAAFTRPALKPDVIDIDPGPPSRDDRDDDPAPGTQQTFDATSTAIDDDWGDDNTGSAEDQGPAFPKPRRHMTFPSGEFEGKDIEEVVATPAGRAYLAGRVAKLKEENRAMVLDWLSWAADEDVDVDNAVQLFGGES